MLSVNVLSNSVIQIHSTVYSINRNGCKSILNDKDKSKLHTRLCEANINLYKIGTTFSSGVKLSAISFLHE